MLEMLKKFSIIDKRSMHQLRMLVLTMIVSSTLEVISVGALVPVLTVLFSNTGSNIQHSFDIIKEYISISNNDFSILLIVIFLLLSFISACVKTYLLWFEGRFAHDTGAELAINIMASYLNLEYKAQKTVGSAEMISGLAYKVTSVVNNALMALSKLFSAFLTLIAMFVLLVYIIGYDFLWLSCLVLMVYLFIVIQSRKYLHKNGDIVGVNVKNRVRFANEAIESIRDIIISGTKEKVINRFVKNEVDLANALTKNHFIGSLPRTVVELILVVLIGLLSIYMVVMEGHSEISLVMVGTVAYSMQRIVPMMQQIYYSATSIMGVSKQLNDVYALINVNGAATPHVDTHNQISTFKFKNSIKLENVSFSYNNIIILDNVDLKIAKGEFVAIIGATGCGKSTLVDLLLGLQNPQSGVVLVDDIDVTKINKQEWYKNISNVSQHIYISGDTIKEYLENNSVTDIDSRRVDYSLKMSCMNTSSHETHFHISSYLGENGRLLSGGQRQRLSLARAYYKCPSLIILDEATSGQDSNTESCIFDNLHANRDGLTLIAITHNKKLLKYFDRVLELKDGKIYCR